MSVQLGPVTYTLNATATAPIDTPDVFLVEDSGKERVFRAALVEITYCQEYVQSGGDPGEAVGPWQAEAVVRGKAIGASGRPGAREAERVYTMDNAPDWLAEQITRLHPSKRA